jgi:hypothetical protein
VTGVLYGYVMRDAAQRVLCTDGEFHADVELDDLRVFHDVRVQVFRNRRSAAGKARYVPCVTTIEEYRR